MISSLFTRWLAAAAIGIAATYTYAYGVLRVQTRPWSVELLVLLTLNVILTPLAYRVLYSSWEGPPDPRAGITFGAFGALGLALYLTYLPAIATEYGSPDDYSLAWSILQGKSVGMSYLHSGRPLAHLAAAGMFAAFPGITGLQSIRAFALFGLILLAWAVYHRLHNLTGSVFVSAAAAFTLCVMPPFLSVTAMTSSFAMSFGALLGWLGGEAAQAAMIQGSQGRRVVWLLGGGLLVLAAVFVFPPAAMFFWVSLAVGAFVNPDAAARPGRWLTLASVGITALVAAYIGFRGIETAYHFENARGTLATDILGKLIWFAKDPLKDGLNYFDLTPSYRLAAVSGMFVLAGVWLNLPQAARPRSINGFAALALVPLSYLPNLVIAENWSSYRTQLALTGLLVVYGLVSLRAVSAWLAQRFHCASDLLFVPAVASLAALAGVAAFINLATTFALPLSLELRYLRYELVEADLPHTSEIWIIRPDYTQGPSAVVRYDEFGIPASSREWGPEPLTRLVLREVAPDYAFLPVRQFPYGADTPTPPPGVITIDMRRLADFRGLE